MKCYPCLTDDWNVLIWYIVVSIVYSSLNASWRETELLTFTVKPWLWHKKQNKKTRGVNRYFCFQITCLRLHVTSNNSLNQSKARILTRSQSSAISPISHRKKKLVEHKTRLFFTVWLPEKKFTWGFLWISSIFAIWFCI